MKVLMVGVDKQTKGGMWTVAENYINSENFTRKTNLKYIPTSITGGKIKRIWFTAKSLVKIIIELIAKNYTIVHIHMAERGSVYRKGIVLILAKIFHCKTVLHMHGAEFELWYKGVTPDKQKFIRNVLNRADKIIILGEYWKEFIVSLVNDKEKVCVVYNAVDVPKENKYNISATNLLFLGVVGQRKGIDDLLAAVKHADKELDSAVKLLIYGPDFENIIENKIMDFGVEDRVEYRGWLDKNEKEEVFKNIAVNILPSYNEGLPMTILETMAFGIPNISTDVAAIPEAVNQENGMVIKPGEREKLSRYIVEIMSVQESRLLKSNLSYKTAKEKYSLEQHFSQILEIYNELEH